VHYSVRAIKKSCLFPPRVPKRPNIRPVCAERIFVILLFMKCSLYLIGETLTGNGPMLRYIKRHLAASGIDPDCIFKSARSEMLCAHSVLDAPEPQTVLVFCDPEHAALTAREIATLTGDTVTLRNDTLLPSAATVLGTDYYRIDTAAAQLHVITASTGRTLPEPRLERAASAVTHLFDVDKEALQTLLKQLAEAYRVKYTLGEPVPGWLQCRMEAERFGDLDGARQQLVTHFLTALATDNVAGAIIAALADANKTVTFAESCTGGLLSYYLTKESGASGVFEGALVTYSNRLKSAWIAVEGSTLEAHGAVSREVVEEMSAGALDVSGADYAVAVSGIAGPTGGTPQKPVGTVHVAVRSKTALKTAELRLHGDRNYIQEQTVLHAVKMLLLLDKKTFFKIS
jgi:nicotinamide-nucleotide amidase